jgi:hypothetical protein
VQYKLITIGSVRQKNVNVLSERNFPKFLHLPYIGNTLLNI